MSLRSEVIRILNEYFTGNKKISELPAGTTPSGDELIEGVQDGESVSFTISQVSSGGSGVLSVVAGTNVTVDDTDPQNPIVSATGGGGGITELEIGTTAITGGSSPSVLRNNAGTLEEYSITGTGQVVMDTNPVLVTPNIGTPSAGVGTNITGIVAANVVNTPAGSISATSVQAAINELDTEKASTGYADAKVADAINDGTTTVAPSQNAVFDALAGKINTTLTRNRVTDDYTLVLTDNFKFVEMNSGTAKTITIPPNSSVAFVADQTQITIGRYGAGTVTIVAGVGVTIRSSDGVLGLRSQYSTGALIKIGTDEWYLIGDIQ